MTTSDKIIIGLKSALRALITVAGLVVALDQAGYLNPDKLFTVKGIFAILAALAGKGIVAAATAKPILQ